MSSTINTNSIDVNYPVPGVNNNSQGFRTNFSAIKTNIDTASTEITDLQNKVIVKAALTGTVTNNDMANTLISNALTRSFRASTFNLGNSLSGVVVVNASLGDVQYGAVTGNTTLQFGGWPPTNTKGTLELELSVSNSSAVISFPPEVSVISSYGVTTLQNYANLASTATITAPYGVSQLNYTLSTIDCGNTIFIEPTNSPRQTTQIQQRTPAPTGFQGDTVGTVCTDPVLASLPTTVTNTTTGTNMITCGSTSGFYLDMPVVFTGVTFGGITTGTTYYVRTVSSNTTFTISATPGTVSGSSAAVTLSTASGSMTATPTSYLYVANNNYDATALEKVASVTTNVTAAVLASATITSNNWITCASTAGYIVNYPIVFTGTSINTIATSTVASSNLIIAGSTAGMIVNMPVTFSGTTFVSDTVTAGSFVIGKTYQILSVGTTNFVTIGASASTVGIVFTATGVGSGTGTATSTVITTAGSFVIGQSYTILTVGTTNFTLIGASANTIGIIFTATGVGSGTGTASSTTVISTNSAYFIKTIANATAFSVSSSFGGSNIALTDATGSMSVNFGNVFGGVTYGTTYYIKEVVNPTTFTISSTPGDTEVALTSATGSMTATNTIDYNVTLNNTTSLAVNDPIIFSGTPFGGLNANAVYYIGSINSPNITVSQSRFNGVAGQKQALSTAAGTLAATSYQGTSIWKRSPLQPW